jgi:ABC-type transport system substrate-binding protein
MQKKSIMLLMLLTGILLLSFPVSAQDDPVILRYPINPDPEHLNPFTATTIAIGVVNRNIYEGLVGLDAATGEPIPWLAESWDVSDDGLVYTFYIRHNAMFHDVSWIEFEDGDRHFMASDFIAAAERSLSEDETLSQHPEWMESVVGAEAFLNGEADSIEGLAELDAYTLEFTLSEPNRLFLFTLGVPAVPAEAYEQLGEDFANMPVGTGPFRFVEWQRDNFLEVEANPDYWQEGKPLLDGIRFINVPDENTGLLQYRENELDLLFSIPTGQRDAVLEEFADEYNEKPGLNVRYFGFKMDAGFFVDEPLVRQAFAHAFNRDLVWNELMEGARFPADLGYLSPSMPASTPANIYDYNPERAAELLEEAGYPGGEGLPEFTLYVFSSAADELSLPVLQEDLRQLGVTLNIEVEDSSTYWDHIGEDDVEMFLSGWSSGYNDPSEVFNYLFLDGRDDTHYDNPEVNDLLRQAMQEMDADARTVLYQQAHDIMTADAPWIVSAYSKVTWLQKPWVNGFDPSGGGTHTAQLWEVSVGITE